MARTQIHWLAGPTGYSASETIVGSDTGAVRVSRLLWDFIGGTPDRRIRRWALAYDVQQRKFTLNDRSAGQWEQAHYDQLAEFYRPAAVLRHMLPKRSLLAAMRAMLSDEEVAAALALSMRGGKQ